MRTSIQGDQINDNAITSEKIMDNSIESSDIKDGSIEGADIKDNSITKNKININLPGQALVTKIVAGTGINLSYNGIDEGTGEVTINSTGGSPFVYEDGHYYYYNTIKNAWLSLETMIFQCGAISLNDRSCVKFNPLLLSNGFLVTIKNSRIIYFTLTGEELDLLDFSLKFYKNDIEQFDINGTLVNGIYMNTNINFSFLAGDKIYVMGKVLSNKKVITNPVLTLYYKFEKL